MDQTDEFLTATMPLFHRAEVALHNGDAGPRIAMWSHADSVTLFGAAMGGKGWVEIEPIFQRLGDSFTDCESYDNEVIAARASGDLAYTVAHERTTASLHGGPPEAYVLRVTTVFHREHDEWKVVHRHADAMASPTAGDVLQQLVSGPEVTPADAPAPLTSARHLSRNSDE